MDIMDQLEVWFTTQLPNVVQALLILLLGWLVALLLATIVRNLLGRLRADERINRHTQPQELNVTRLVSQAVFWLVMLFAVVGALDALELPSISEPLQGFLDQVIAFIPNLIGAGILIAVAWVVATVVKRLIEGALGATDWDERLQRGAQLDQPVPLGASLGTLAYWLIWLLFLPAILDALELGGLLSPVEAMVGDVLGFLPNLLSAAIILLVGYFVARIVRDIVVNLLAATGLDALGARFGFGGTPAVTTTDAPAARTTETSAATSRGAARVTDEPLTLSRLIGTVVFALILIPVIITALDALNIEALSEPAIAMLNQILAAIPNIFAAVILLGLAYFVARFVADLASDLLTGVGFDRILSRIGLSEETPGTTPPSRIAGMVILAAIMLFAAAEAADLLGFAALASLITGFLLFLGNVILGLIVLALGLYLARVAGDTIRTSGIRNADLLARIARYAIILLVIFMALQQMGIAVGIVTLAFGLLLGAIAVAFAIAVGLGGREIASRELERLTSELRNRPEPPADPVSRPDDLDVEGGVTV